MNADGHRWFGPEPRSTDHGTRSFTTKAPRHKGQGQSKIEKPKSKIIRPELGPHPQITQTTRSVALSGEACCVLAGVVLDTWVSSGKDKGQGTKDRSGQDIRCQMSDVRCEMSEARTKDQVGLRLSCFSLATCFVLSPCYFVFARPSARSRKSLCPFFVPGIRQRPCA